MKSGSTNNIDLLHPFFNSRVEPKVNLKYALKAYRDSLVDKSNAFKTVKEIWKELEVEEVHNS